MKVPYQRLTLMLSIGLAMTSIPKFEVQAEETKNSSTKHLTGIVTQSELNDSLERLGLNCAVAVGPPVQLFVEKVRIGSVAYYGGVASGDKIILFTEKSNGYQLRIEREGKIYEIFLRSIDGGAKLNGSEKDTVLFSEAAVHDQSSKHLTVKTSSDFLKGNAKSGLLQGTVDQRLLKGAAQDSLLKGNANQDLLKATAKEGQLQGGANTTALQGNAKDDLLKSNIETTGDNQIRKLKDVDVELIIDITGSMTEHDGTGNLTKFQWCQQETAKMMGQVRSLIPRVTITTFNTQFTTEENCDAQRIADIYANTTPQGRTDLVDPISSRLNKYLDSWHTGKRPLLIAVLHDGLPNVPEDPNVVKKAIIEATRRMVEPDEITITFLQIGDSFEGRDFLLDLDDDLVNEGAKYDIVDTKTFPELKSEGLTKCLVDALTEHKALAKSSGVNSSIRRVQREIGRRRPELRPSFDTSKLDSEIKQKRDERYALEKLILGK